MGALYCCTAVSRTAPSTACQALLHCALSLLAAGMGIPPHAWQSQVFLRKRRNIFRLQGPVVSLASHVPGEEGAPGRRLLAAAGCCCPWLLLWLWWRWWGCCYWCCWVVVAVTGAYSPLYLAVPLAMLSGWGHGMLEVRPGGIAHYIPGCN